MTDADAQDSVTVVLVDDHPVVRNGLRAWLESRAGIEVVGEAATARDAVSLVAATGPGVVVLDLRLPDGSGLDVLRQVRTGRPPPGVLVLTSFGDDADIVAAVEAGADGFLHKDAAPAEIEAAVRAVARGETALSARATAALVRGVRNRRPAAVDALTPREREVLGLLAEGRSNAEIAAALTIATKTVKTHVSSILTKLDVDDRTQAALAAVRLGLGS